MIADLDGYIGRKAAELAQPRIDAARLSAEASDQRVADLQQEFGRRIRALERQLESARRQEGRADREDLLASIWLYVDWYFVTRQLTTEQKDLWADAIDARHARANADDPDLGALPVERWWRDGT